MIYKLLVALFFLFLLTDNRSFVHTAPLDLKNESELKKPWKIYNRDYKFEFFDVAKEKKWSGPFYFIQGADTQYGFIARELEHKKDVTWEEEIALTKNIVKQVNKMNPKPKFFVMCGDLCDAMPDDDLELRKKQEITFKEIFQELELDIPLVCVCGNHDVGNTPTEKTVKLYNSSFGDTYFSFWCGGVLFLVINSQYFFDSSQVTKLAEDHSKWIEDQIEEAKKANARIIVFQHIPWFVKSADEEDSYFAIKSEIRRTWLDKFKKAGVEAIFCGHYHRNAGGIYDGMEVVVTSAVGGQLGSDVSGARLVKVLDNKIEHSYYGIDDLPLNNQL